MSTVQERINKIIKEQISFDQPLEIRPDHNLIADLGADSLDLIEILMEIEESFDIEIADEDAEAWSTVQDVYATVEKIFPSGLATT